MPAPVVIDMGVVEPQAVLVASMVEACKKAVGDGDCHLIREAPQGPYRAIAILTWDGPDKVRVEVGLHRDAGTEWRTRLLSFQPEDVELERYRSIGFVVGTLATEEAAAAPPPDLPPPPAPVPAKPPDPPKPPPAPRPAPAPASPAESSVGIVGTIGGALDQGGPRYGAGLRGRLGIAPWIGVAASVGGSARPREGGLSLRYLDAGLGVAVPLVRAEPLGLELTPEVVLEHFRAEAEDNGVSAVRQRLVAALRLELDVVWAVAPAVDVVAGGNVFARPASTRVVVQGTPAGETGQIELGVAAGARLRF